MWFACKSCLVISYSNDDNVYTIISNFKFLCASLLNCLYKNDFKNKEHQRIYQDKKQSTKNVNVNRLLLSRMSSSPWTLQVNRRSQDIQLNIILESHIICCTLSTSGSMLLEMSFRKLGHEPFSCVIVDEVSGSKFCNDDQLVKCLG